MTDTIKKFHELPKTSQRIATVIFTVFGPMIVVVSVLGTLIHEISGALRYTWIDWRGTWHDYVTDVKKMWLVW